MIMFDFEWPENLSIFFDNLCVYYVGFDILSFLTILFTWWFCTSSNKEKSQDEVIGTGTEENEKDENIKNEKLQADNPMLDWSDDAIMSNVKFLRQKALVKELKSKLTKDELEEEKKTEKMQLEKIFQLLQEQEDKFQMSSMEQLEDQLHLYIN